MTHLFEDNEDRALTAFAKKHKDLPEPQGPKGGADICFLSPQPDTSLHCQTTDTWLVHRAVCLFTSQLSPVLIAKGWPG